MDYIAFFFAVRHTEFDYLMQTMLEYNVGLYIVAKETAQGDAHAETAGEHFHFVVQMSDADYHKFSKRIKEKYSLNGKAKDGKARQYGKVPKIKNLERMMVYTVKDKNVRSNMSEEELDRLKELSFKKEEKKKLEDEIIKFLLECEELKRPYVRVQPTLNYATQEDAKNSRNRIDSIYVDYDNCGQAFFDAHRLIIEFHLDRDISIPPPTMIKNYIKLFFVSLPIDNYYKAQIIRKFQDVRNPFMHISD